MKSRVLAALAVVSLIASAQQWQIALPGYRYDFPRDYFNHPEYRTEWWYYTGNLRAANGHRYGFELTFFRQAVPLAVPAAVPENATWRPDQLYLAHLAMSDIDGQTFYYTERLNRAGPGLAGISLQQQRYWNGNWQVRWSSLETGDQQLQAVCDRFTLTLNLKPEKPIVIHGQNGVSRRGPASGQASHYISFTRIAAQGRLDRSGESIALAGFAWMDHEFFTERDNNDAMLWDWFAIQLDDNEELMLYRLRDRSGRETPYSSATYVDAAGKARFLNSTQFSVTPGERWQSPHSGARYPTRWSVTIPELGLHLSEQTPLKDQELFTKDGVSPTYWEGAVSYQGQIHKKNVTGVGYLEMTGYARGGRNLLCAGL